MWTVVYISQNIETAKEIVEILEKNKIITRMQTITGEGEAHSYEILVPDSEKEEAHNIILYME